MPKYVYAGRDRMWISTNSQPNSGTRRVVSITLRMLCRRERTGNLFTRGRVGFGAGLYAKGNLARSGFDPPTIKHAASYYSSYVIPVATDNINTNSNTK
jgi:hypothetical protein